MDAQMQHERGRKKRKKDKKDREKACLTHSLTNTIKVFEEAREMRTCNRSWREREKGREKEANLHGRCWSSSARAE